MQLQLTFLAQESITAPHVTIAVGTINYLNALLAAPFPTFTFSPVGGSVHQFGNYGTTMKLLHS